MLTRPVQLSIKFWKDTMAPFWRTVKRELEKRTPCLVMPIRRKRKAFYPIRLHISLATSQRPRTTKSKTIDTKKFLPKLYIILCFRFLVRVSYMEIYNEEVRDLLGKELCKSLEVKERADIGVYVKDLSGYVVHNADDLDNIMKLGNKKRKQSYALIY